MNYESKAPLWALPSLSDCLAIFLSAFVKGAVVFSPLAKISTESRPCWRLSLDKLQGQSSSSLFHVKQAARSIFLGRVYNRQAATACNFLSGGYIVKQGFMSAAAYVCVEIIRVLRGNEQV